LFILFLSLPSMDRSAKLNLPAPCFVTGFQHLISRANQTLKLSQSLMGLRPKVQGDAASFFVAYTANCHSELVSESDLLSMIQLD